MPADARARAKSASERLDAWLLERAYPLWADVGFDAASGRFAEKIAMDGTRVDLPSRGRVPPRQIYAFAVAPEFGWTGDAGGIVRKGVEAYLLAHQRPDELFRPVGGLPANAPDADKVELYDQAFALFGLAAAHPWLDGGLERTAIAVRLAIRRRLGHPAGGFRGAWPPRLLESNPQMHLLEASMAWAERCPDPAWPAMAQEIIDLASDRFIDPVSGALREFFSEDWRPANGLAGRLVEPGHQYEWAWLMLRWADQTGEGRLKQMALRLIEVAESHGVDRQRGVAVDELLDDFTVHRPTARLWPQTERIKAGCLAANLTGQARYWDMAAGAAEALERYLQTPVEGLWRDVLLPTGDFAEQPAPASSLYHIVLALSVLREELRKSEGLGARALPSHT